ncbi:GAS2 protein 3 [Fasciola hepatica]|uniref:GAS2 protein 3 n=1 Tax=Fasciola hepatica TaxID=6192 RepID=A0A4E0S0H9_FASHE|nr:GAS2 protein 3 [Fasciola hepatica]
MPSIPVGLTRSAHDLRESGFIDTEGHSSKFIQILDESMCVVREDICDWLQRYMFSSVNAPEIEAQYLLFRLRSGLWLSRLAYKLHCSVLHRSSDSVPHIPEGSHEFLRGGVSNPNLRTLSRSSLPPFPRTLILCAKLPLSPGDTCCYPEPEKSCESSATSSCSSPDHTPIRPGTPGQGCGSLRVADRWVARDNVSTFLRWCKELGIPSTVLFETTGLVHRTEEKNVLLTLMELARIAGRFGLNDLPELVLMEREIDLLEAKRAQTSIDVVKKPTYAESTNPETGSNSQISVVHVQLREQSADLVLAPDNDQNKVSASGDIVSTQTTIRIGGKTRLINIKRSGGPHSQTVDAPVQSQPGVSVGTDPLADVNDISTEFHGSPRMTNSASSVSTSTDERRKQTVGTDPDKGSHNQSGSGDRTGSERHPADPFVAEQVERKVAQCTCCTRLHLQYLEEGRYRLGTRVYYFRRFRNHVMVRVGGGWLTLDAFLERHDPCRRGKSTVDAHRIAPLPDARSSVTSSEPSPEKLVEQMPSIKPAMPMGGSMIDLRRRWSKHSTSSNESSSSQTSVRSTALTVPSITTECSEPTRIQRTRPPNPSKTRISEIVQKKPVALTSRTRPSTPVSRANNGAVQPRESSTRGRRVTPSPRSCDSRPSSKDAKPVRWR